MRDGVMKDYGNVTQLKKKINVDFFFLFHKKI